MHRPVQPWESTDRGQIVNQQPGQAAPPAGERLTVVWRCKLPFRLVGGVAKNSTRAATRGYLEHPDRREAEIADASRRAGEFFDRLLGAPDVTRR